MNDEHLYTTAPDGRAFRAVIYEGKYVPLGMVKYVIEVYIPECEWWYAVERSDRGWYFDYAAAHCESRLNWWTEHYLEMPVAVEIGALDES